jgi:hypothetical protein
MKLYHVSYDNHGPSVTFFPREPKNRAPNEPAKPARICVSTRIGDALRLTAWKDGSHKFHVYSTEVKQLPVISRTLPKKYVPDYKKWGREEIWLLKKQSYTFSYLGYIRMFRLEMIIGCAFWYFKRGGGDYINVNWGDDPTQLTPMSIKGYVQGEAQQHLQMREFIRDVKRSRFVEASKPRLAKYADDVFIAEQIKEGKTPYRVPLKRRSNAIL